MKKIEAEAFYHNRMLWYLKFQSDVEVENCAFACCPIIKINKPDTMTLGENVFVQDTTFDKFAFWD